ncbi:probable G-protein coupled receptor 160 isoform X5 [Panthera tigris]|uniref:probable G-protein coupled receptor 160 isoform X5 n=1 Tax=Panthera tigris TaxID=9694 RepID=UPI001C6F917C|nr:probable G-protein coupled receptor 160 isoform X5 [Panthera tigris]
MVYVIFLSWHPEVDVISHVHRRTCVRWGRTSRHLSWPFRVGDRVPARAGTEIKLRDFSGLFVLRDRGTLVALGGGGRGQPPNSGGDRQDLARGGRSCEETGSLRPTFCKRLGVESLGICH